MTEETEIQWYSLLADYFGVKLTDADKARWYSEIQTKYRNISNIRICSAIRWASDERNIRRDKMQGKPTVAEVMKWIGIYSWRERNQNEVSHVVCSLCDGSGWISYARELKDKPAFTFNEHNLAITTKIPCACSQGRKAFEITYGQNGRDKDKDRNINEQDQMIIAKEAVKQRMIYSRLRKQLEVA